MEFGAHLPLVDFGGTRQDLSFLSDFTRAAADTGYRYLCANDHLVFTRPWLDGPTALAAVAGVSGDMTLATTVVVPALRGPAATAKALAAIDILSGGRLLVAAGPGSSPRDYALMGVPFEERWKRLEESVHVMRASWARSSESFTGKFYTTAGEKLEPLPVQDGGPKVWIGSWGSAAGLQRVARLADGWLASGYNITAEGFRAALEDLKAQLRAQGKVPETFPNGLATCWLYVTGGADEAERVLADVLSPMLNRSVEELRVKLLVGSPEHCAEIIASYRAAGVQRIFLWPVADEIRQLEEFQSRVVPLL